MRRRTGILAATTACLLVCLIAQSPRDAYRGAFKTWREAEPNLERDAASTGDALAARTTHAAAGAANYGAARAAFLRMLAEDQGQSILWLQNTAPENVPALAPAADELRMTNSANSLLATNIATFANDPDRGIQQLRQALERERDALSALSTSINDRQKASDKTAQAVMSIDQARQKALTEYQAAVASINSEAASVDKETPAWGGYYQRLSQGARGVAPAPVTSSVAAPATQASGVPPPQRAPSITPLPLARYVGAWTYPTVGGMFHGAEPEFVDLVVHEENGHADGTFYARFKTAAGTDPLIRFDFNGDFKATRNQVFNLVTSDGAKGTIELIPGNAFNLLEVNFQSGALAGKIRSADLLLIKK